VREGCGKTILPPFASALEVMTQTPLGSPMLKAREALVLNLPPAGPGSTSASRRRKLGTHRIDLYHEHRVDPEAHEAARSISRVERRRGRAFPARPGSSGGA
jgi:hypothetical protein